MGQLKTAVIMAGGQGTRLQSVTGVLPKPMVNIRNTTIENFGKAKDTILEHQIDMLSENGITNFILVVGNKKEYIQAAFTNEIINHNIPGRNITIRYFAEDRPLGTAGAFCSRELQDMIQEDDFLFTYADVLFDINVGKMFELHDKERADATVLISPCSEPDDRPLCVCEKGSNIISGIIPKQGKTDGPRGGSFPNTPKNGIMILNKSALQLLPSQPTYLDMEESILTRLIYSGAYKVCAWNTPCYIKDIGTVDRYYEGVSELARNIPTLRNPAKNPQKCVIFKAKDLIKVTEECFFEGIKYAKEGNYLFEISAAIGRYANERGYGVVKDLCGHGIGSKLHEAPEIPNYEMNRKGPRLRSGMTLAIEPMINIGTWQVNWLDDDWTVVTRDGSLSAHYENTVLITADGPKLLTLSK